MVFDEGLGVCLQNNREAHEVDRVCLEVQRENRLSFLVESDRTLTVPSYR